MPRESLHARVVALHAQRAAQSRLRVRRVVTRREGLRCEVDGRWLLDCCGNDYLGLARHPRVAAALRDAAAALGVGAGASAQVSGHHAEHDALAHELADWLEAPSVLLFGSGYQANLAVLQALLGRGDLCVEDRLDHASLIDGARLSGANLRRYPHADVDAARRQLQSQPDGAALLATDGVFSMEGDVAPLAALAALARDSGAVLYVDEAHAVGVLGPQGRGSVAAAGLGVESVPLRLVTFGKALGGLGAAVVGDAALVAHLAQVARPHVYTTALPPALAAALRAAVRLARGGDALRERLHRNIRRFRERALAAGLPLAPSTTPIQPLLCRDDARALALAEALERRGFWVAAIRPPTVPAGGARLRITLSALHAPSDIDALIDALAQAWAERPA